jgi:beta-glucosidase
MDSASGDTAASIDVPHESEHAIRIEYLRVGNDRMVALQWTTPDAALLKEAIMKAKEADVIVAFVGLSPDLEGEQMSVKIPGFSGGDRTSIYLPSSQEQLLEAMHASGKPVVVVLQSGSAVSTSWADTNASAILEAWYGGEAAGTAIARTLSGANNPSGKLPVTFYRSVDDLPPFTDYSMAGRTYRYYAGQPLYPFGFGLSYSKFQLSSVHLSSSEVKADVDPVIEGTITNLGMRAGSETIQVYVDPASNGLGHAPRLVGFRRVDLCAGGTASFSVTINSRWLSHVAENGEHVLSAGPYALHVGTGQPRFTSDDRRLNLVVTGDLRMPR